MKKATFHWKHFTLTFQKKSILADQGSLDIEFRDDDYIHDILPNIFGRVLSRIPGSEYLGKEIPHETHGFIHQNKTINADPHIWKRKLGSNFAPQQPDFIEITASFPPEIQKRFIKEDDDYGDWLSVQ